MFIEYKPPAYPHKVGTKFQLASAQRITGPFEIIAHTTVKHGHTGEALPAYTIAVPNDEHFDQPVDSLRHDIQPI